MNFHTGLHAAFATVYILTLVTLIVGSFALADRVEKDFGIFAAVGTFIFLAGIIAFMIGVMS